MNGRSHATRKQQQVVQQLVYAGHGPAAIHRLLREKGLYDDPHPELHKRTIERMVRRMIPEDDSGPWSAMDDPDQARLVHDVAAYVHFMSEGRVWISKDLAQRIAGVRTVDPEIPPHFAYWLARAYQSARSPEEVRNLDLELGLKPWKELSENTSDPMVQYIATMDGWRKLRLRDFEYPEEVAAAGDTAGNADSKLTAEPVDSSRHAETDARGKRRPSAGSG